jgi:hypothetical protein
LSRIFGDPGQGVDAKHFAAVTCRHMSSCSIRVYVRIIRIYERFILVHVRFIRVYVRFIRVYGRFILVYVRFIRLYLRFIRLYLRSIGVKEWMLCEELGDVLTHQATISKKKFLYVVTS